MTIKTLTQLPFLSRFEDAALALLRLFVGMFLMWETWDNVKSAERMAEFVTFMQTNGFPAAEILAPLSVWAQFICGALLIFGLLTRWAGVVMAFNFIVAFLMVHLDQPLRAQFPALILVFVSLYFAAKGSGRFGLDYIKYGDL